MQSSSCNTYSNGVVGTTDRTVFCFAVIAALQGQVEMEETENGNGKLKRKTEAESGNGKAENW